MKTPYHLLFCITLFSFPAFALCQTDTIQVDFGGTPTPGFWNNLTNSFNGQISNLVNSSGFSTNISLTIFDAFNSTNSSGTQMPDPGLGIPATASGDSFFGNTVLFGSQIQATAGVELANLDPAKAYTLTVFASRLASDNRETEYAFSGETKDTLYLNVSSNLDSVVTTTLFPAPDGTIKIEMQPGPNNDNTYGFFYLGALKLSYASSGNQDTAYLKLKAPLGGEFWQVDETPYIAWESEGISQVVLEYSINNGVNWVILDTVLAFKKSYTWSVLGTPSTDCLIRVSADTLSDQSPAIFEISNSQDSCLLVVLGSSTAQGAGATQADSSWVNRFRNHIYQKDTRQRVRNLAKGGYTTYHILPTGSSVPSGISIDEDRNLTKALSLNPTGIIINMPSNDAANLFDVGQQMSNFGLLTATAAAEGVTSWVCTTQPRNFADPAKIQIQLDVRDSIIAAYGDRAIDFWSGIADSMGFIASNYDSGDGVHLNNAGHRLLFGRVKDKDIPKTSCGIVSALPSISPRDPQVNAYPNPFAKEVTFEVETPGPATVWLHIFDSQGRSVTLIEQRFSHEGRHQILWNPPGLTSFFYAQIKIISASSIKEKTISLIRFHTN